MVREHSVESFYSNLRQSSASSPSSPLLIFPSTSDVDSLCALKIIFHILESDSIRYACYPVSSFKEIHSYIPVNPQEPLSILLLNWGSHRNLLKILPIGTFTRVFVIDSHRPIHLHNLSSANQHVIVLYTHDDELHSDLSYDFDVSSLANAADFDEADEDNDEEEEEEEDSEEEEEEEEEERRKRRKVSEEDEHKEDPVKLFKKLKKEYYSMGNFHGRPSGCLMYELSYFLRKNTNETLWMGCVSLTDQLVHARLTDERYNAGVMELEQHINTSCNLEVATKVTLKDGTTIRAPSSSRIAYEDEPKLMLLREWTLFESMLCSSYIATKLKTWSENGMKKLKLLLARMGFPLVDCQQKFEYMSVEVKKKMKEEFERFLPEYGLTNFYYRSFMRIHGYTSRVSAADVVYGVTALLESFGEGERWCGSKQFGVAYDALSLNNLEKLRFGMQQAIKVQRAILRQGSAAITRGGCIRSGRKFRWVKVEDSVDARLLGYPQALTKLCYFLMDALKEKGARMKPLLCACVCQDEGEHENKQEKEVGRKEKKKVLIVGVCGKMHVGCVEGNWFGVAFRCAAEETGAEFFHEMFESSWIVLDFMFVNSFMIRLADKL